MSNGAAKRKPAGHLPPSKRRKTGTQSDQKYRFESFSDRVSNLNISSLRREQSRQRVSVDDDSFFKASLHSWRDRNLSSTFKAFLRQAEPLSGNLPQILHYADQIHALLIEYIEKQDTVSLEPLLALVADFAHDLGARFEKYFQKTVEVLTLLAAHHDGLEVIEWSFACLAWLFKYLSRLLVPDLRPLFALMAPLLGKRRQKDFITRFAAESLSFLLRKAAGIYHKGKDPLNLVITQALEDPAVDEGEQTLYNTALAALFAESIRGVGRSVHSTAPALVDGLLTVLVQKADNGPLSQTASRIVAEALTSVMPATNAQGFRPVLDVVLAHLSSECKRRLRVSPSAMILNQLLQASSGSHVANWDHITQVLSEQLDLVFKDTSPEQMTIDEAIMILANVLAYGPYGQSHSLCDRYFSDLDRPFWATSFLGLNKILNDVIPERFGALMFSHLTRLGCVRSSANSRYIDTHWQSQPVPLCAFLLDVRSHFPAQRMESLLPHEWCLNVRDTVTSLTLKSSSPTDTDVAFLSGFLVLAGGLPENSASKRALLVAIEQLLLNQSESGIESENTASVFAMTTGLYFLAQSTFEDDGTILKKVSLTPLSYLRRPVFLRALLALSRKLKPNEVLFNENYLDTIAKNLSSPSSALRSHGLDLLCSYTKSNGVGPLDVALGIENTQFSYDAQRTVGMQARRMASLLANSSPSDLVVSAIVHYCFGLLHVRLTSAWDDGCAALNTLRQLPKVDDLVIQQSIAWLRHESPSIDMPESELENPDENLARYADTSKVARILVQQFHSHTGHDVSKAKYRTQALRVLKSMPSLAEKRSRYLVPILLDWAGVDARTGLKDDEPTQGGSWSHSDRLLLLGVFVDFTNPTVLFRSSEVFDALLVLLSNGDADTQRMALKAIFNWKTPGVVAYERQLLNVLDDARFRDELTCFTDSEHEDGVKSEHWQDLMPVLLRLLYGRVTTRAGLGGSRGTQESRRKAVFRAVQIFGDDAIGSFIAIATKTLSISDPEKSEVALSRARKQFGVMRLLGNFVEELGDSTTVVAPQIIEATTHCLFSSSAMLQAATSEEQEDIAPWKAVRHESLSCFNILSDTYTDKSWIYSYKAQLFEHVIGPRLSNLPIETAQAPSIMLKIFSTWSKSPETVLLLWDPEPELVKTVLKCLTVPSAKDEVRLFVLQQILSPILGHAQEHPYTETLVKDCAAQWLDILVLGIEQSPSKDVFEALIQLLLMVQPFICDTDGYEKLLSIIVDLLSGQSKRINPRTKSAMTLLMQSLLAKVNLDHNAGLRTKLTSTVSQLFSYFRDSTARQRLVGVMNLIATQDTTLETTARICRKLNTFSSTRLAEPDFDARGEAFAEIQSDDSVSNEPVIAEAIVHNLLFFIQDEDELATRSSASVCLRHLVRRAGSTPESSAVFRTLVDVTLLPAISQGFRHASEFVRLEYVAVLAELVKIGWTGVDDMRKLLGDDDESSIFNTILHIQSHRRIRAIHRLADACSEVKPVNITRFCLPLIEHCLVNNDDVANEALPTLRRLVMALDWQRCRALLFRKTQDDRCFSTKLQIRTLSAVIDAIYESKKAFDASEEIKKGQSQTLIKSLPDSSGLAQALNSSVLEKILKQIHFQTEDAAAEQRVLLAVAAVKLLLTFPQVDVTRRLSALLIDVCNMLKSRSQDVRDSTRKTLSDIAVALGPSHFRAIIKNLRYSLTKGYQLHVLNFTVHSLAVNVATKFPTGSIDYCLDDIASIVMDDVFGKIALEKESSGFLSTVKEAKKKSLGQDTIETLATLIELESVDRLLRHIRAEMSKLRPRWEAVDEALRRLREGLRRNSGLNEKDTLHFLLDMINNEDQEPSSQASAKILSFAFDLLRRVVDKHEQLKTVDNLASAVAPLVLALKHADEEVQLAAMRFLSSIVKVPLPGLDEHAGACVRQAKQIIEASASTNAPNAQTALRLIAAILRERPGAIMTKSHFEHDMAFLLARVRPDLEEPASGAERDRQVAAFTFVKAIMSKGVKVKEMYEIMDTVRQVMIKSRSPPVPDLARSIYARFILDYFPEEGKGFQKQLDFLSTNLQYEHDHGRQSVLEVMSFVVSRRDGASVFPVLLAFFLPVAMAIAVDSKTQAHTQAATSLLVDILDKAGKTGAKDARQQFEKQLLNWLAVDSAPMWRFVACNFWQAWLSSHVEDMANAELVCSLVVSALKQSAKREEPPALDTLATYSALYQCFPAIATKSLPMKLWRDVISNTNLQDMATARMTMELVNQFIHNDLVAIAVSAQSKSDKPPFDRTVIDAILEPNFAIIDTSDLAADSPLVSKAIDSISRLRELIDHSFENYATIEVLQHSIEMLRREIDTTTPPYTRRAILELLSALITSESTLLDLVDEHAEEILISLSNIISQPTVPTSAHPAFASVYGQVLEAAQKSLDDIQTRLGSETYIKRMQAVGQTIRARREERKRQRALGVVAKPEAHERQRRRRHDAKRERRKVKSSLEAGRRRGW